MSKINALERRHVPDVSSRIEAIDRDGFVYIPFDEVLLAQATPRQRRLLGDHRRSNDD